MQSPPPDDVEESSRNSVLQNENLYYVLNPFSIAFFFLGSLFLLIISFMELSTTDSILRFFGPVLYLLNGLSCVFRAPGANELRIATLFSVASLWDLVSAMAKGDDEAQTAFFLLAAHFYFVYALTSLYWGFQRYKTLTLRKTAMLGDFFFLIGAKIKVGASYAMVIGVQSLTSKSIIDCSLATAVFYFGNACLVILVCAAERILGPRLPPSVVDGSSPEKSIEII
mmetsp:Transcript_11884/g.18232  ORF Transcript_11884/g.18232 Transcript_11884/m.18232 type:complete len:226 (-) Transcript_11884:60-737(-)